MIKKKSQFTAFDKKYQEKQNGEPEYHYYGPKQQILPMYGNNPSFLTDRENYDKAHNWSSDIAGAHNKPKEVSKEPINLNFPEIQKEWIKARHLTEEELAELDKKDRKERQQRSEYAPYYARSQEEQHFRDPLRTLHERNTNKHSPEEYREKIFNIYQLFRKTTADFLTEYKKANEYAQSRTGIDYSKSYRDIFKQFPQYLISAIRASIGELFGLVRSGRRGSSWGETEAARALIEEISKGINIFNITPLNMEEKMLHMRRMIFQMRKIMGEIERREKLLTKLPQHIETAIKEILRDKQGKEFLQWMEENYPGDKQEFVERAMKDIFSNWSSKNEVKFSFEDLKNFKTYKSVFEKTRYSTRKLIKDLHKNTVDKIQTDLADVVYDKVMLKVKTLFEAITDYTNKVNDPVDYDNKAALLDFIKYIKTNYKVDLSGLFAFIDTILSKWAIEQRNLYGEGHSFDGFVVKFFSEFSKELEQKISGVSINENNKDNWFIRNTFVSDIISNLMFNISSGKIDLARLVKMNSQDLDDAINKVIVSKIVIKSLPNFNPSERAYSTFPPFASLGKVFAETGKFSTDAFLKLFQSQFPSVPRDFALHLVRLIMKQDEKTTVANTMTAFNLLHIGSKAPGSSFAMPFLLDFLKKHNKFNSDTFTKIFTTQFSNLLVSVDKLKHDLSLKTEGKGATLINAILFSAIRSPQTIEQDLKNLDQFISFIHNEAGSLPKIDVISILQSQMFQSFSKVAVVKKLIEVFSEIKAKGGIKGIHKKYDVVIRDLMKRNYISRDFYKNIQLIYSIFTSGAMVSPATENYQAVLKATNSLETDFEIIEMSDSFKELLNDYKEKDPNLFKLDFQVNDRLRFRVLRDRDPMILRVGVLTDCCQRIGGVGQSAAKDSFVNPLASVVILEWKNDENKWVLLAQSYFHYVPADNAYILDNVETNKNNVNESGVDLEVIYAYWAAEMKAKYDLKYLTAGKGYSKIRTSAFNTHSMDEDPRSFSPVATKGEYRNEPYSDYDEKNAINLLSPQFDLEKQVQEKLGKDWHQEKEKEKKAFEKNLRRIVLGSFNDIFAL